MPSRAERVIDALPTVFRPEKAAGAKATIQFHLIGEGGGDWAIDVSDGQCQIQSMIASQPDATLTMEAEDFAALYLGETNPFQAFMQGKIKVDGNVTIVMQLLNWFDREAL